MSLKLTFPFPTILPSCSPSSPTWADEAQPPYPDVVPDPKSTVSDLGLLNSGGMGRDLWKFASQGAPQDWALTVGEVPDAHRDLPRRLQDLHGLENEDKSIPWLLCWAERLQGGGFLIPVLTLLCSISWKSTSFTESTWSPSCSPAL